jgi:3-oxoacyl-[acyl-carrier protein] reductase
MNSAIEGKAALVGGASSGIGLACARALAAEGARVVLLARDAARLAQRVQELRQAGAEAHAVAGDLSRTETLPDLVRQAREHTGRIDILVNNTGGPPSGDPLSFSAEDWQNAFRLTFLSAETVTRLLLPEMADRGWGRIINLASVSVLTPLPGLILSNSIRLAVVGWARTLARQYAGRGVTINTIAMGYTLTGRIEELHQETARREGRSYEEVLAQATARIPMARMARPEEIAAAVVFLAGEGASYITGAVLPVDGGYSLGG